jgi:hypothetical protein
VAQQPVSAASASIHSETQPWDKQPGESGPAFEAFVVFRTLGYERSLTRVAKELNKSVQLIGRWSLRDDWKQRVDAWDQYCDEQAQRDTIKQRSELHRAVLLTAQAMHSKALAALMVFDPVDVIQEKDKDGKVISTKKVMGIKPNELVHLFECSYKAQERVLGKPDEDRVAKIEVIIGDAPEEERSPEEMEREAQAARELQAMAGATARPQ